MAKIKTSRESEFNSSRIVGQDIHGSGKIEFDEKGISKEDFPIEIANKVASASSLLSLVASEKELESLNQETEEVVEENVVEEEETFEVDPGAPDITEGEEEEDDDSEEVTDEDLEGMSMGQLRDILKEAGVPKSEYSHIKGNDGKADLVKLVKEKIS